MLFVIGGGLFLAYKAGWLSRSTGPAAGKDGSDAGKPQPTAEKKPVSEEILEELRHAVKAQQASFDIVQKNFDAGRFGTKELCAAKDLLLEARIKLATAEGQPVTALLEDLVRNREEQLGIAKLLVEVGKSLESEVLDASARLSEARARLAAARAESLRKKP
jgi:outer membrane protein TolC